MFPWTFGAGTRCSKATLQTLFKNAINDCSLPVDLATGKPPSTAFPVYRNLVQLHLAHGKYVHSDCCYVCNVSLIRRKVRATVSNIAAKRKFHCKFRPRIQPSVSDRKQAADKQFKCCTLASRTEVIIKLLWCHPQEPEVRGNNKPEALSIISRTGHTKVAIRERGSQGFRMEMQFFFLILRFLRKVALVLDHVKVMGHSF